MPPLGSNTAATLGLPAGPPVGTAGAGGQVAYPALTIAQQLAAAAQLPAVQKITDAQAASDAAARSQQQTIQGYMHALAPIIAGIAPGVQQGYQQAAGMDALLGKGFGNELQGQQQQNQEQANGILQTAGATPGQAGAVGSAIGGPGVANALGWLNGGLPATGLNQAGAAFGAAARALPAEFAGEGMQQVQSSQARQSLADAGFAQKQSDLAAQYPGLVTKNYLQVQNQQATQAYHDATIKISAARADIAAQAQADAAAYQKGELSARDYANKIAATRANNAQLDAQQRETIAQYNANTSRMNAGTNRIRALKPTLTGTNATGKFLVNPDGSYSRLPGPLGKPATSGSQQRLLAGQIKAMYGGTAPRYIHSPGAPGADANGFLEEPGTGPGTAKPYTDAINYAVAAGKTPAQARAIVNQIYKPGYPLGANGAAIPGVSRPYEGRQAVKIAMEFFESAMQAKDSKQVALQHATSTGLFPAGALRTALRNVWEGFSVKEKGGFGFTATSPPEAPPA